MTRKNIKRAMTAIAATSIAGLCFGSAPFAAVASEAGPTLISGKIDSQVVHIGVLPAAPRVTLDLHGETERVYLYFTGPTGQLLNQYFYVSKPNAKSTFDASGIASTLSPYSPAGTWTLTEVYVCSSSSCSDYSGAALTPLFPSLTFMVVNPHSDTTPPTINSAVIKTPTVHASNNAKFYVDVNIGDDLSGVASALIYFTDAPGDTIGVGGSLSFAVKSPTTYELAEYCRCARFRTGDYTATKVVLTDAAGNVTTITDAGEISSLFGGQPTIALTD